MTTCPHCGKDTDKPPKEPNVALFRGEYTEFPERLWPIAECIRDVWRFALPAAPRKREKKSTYTFWINSMDEIYNICGARSVEVLTKLHKDYVAYAGTHQGTWPHSVAGPQSLVNVCRGKLAEMSTETQQVTSPKTGLQQFLEEHHA